MQRLRRGGDLTCPDNTTCEDRVVTSVWPDKAAVEALFAGPDYEEVRAFYHAAFTMHCLLLQDGGANTENPNPKL